MSLILIISITLRKDGVLTLDANCEGLRPWNATTILFAFPHNAPSSIQTNGRLRAHGVKSTSNSLHSEDSRRIRILKSSPWAISNASRNTSAPAFRMEDAIWRATQASTEECETKTLTRARFFERERDFFTRMVHNRKHRLVPQSVLQAVQIGYSTRREAKRADLAIHLLALHVEGADLRQLLVGGLDGGLGRRQHS